jgi:sulfur relay (sulfurtransferase) complex TusBCD TusD component (DsrE family)
VVIASADASPVLLVVMGAPYESELVTTVFRLVDATLAKRHRLLVWTCGGATSLTVRGVGEAKPPNLLRRSTEYPSTAHVVSELMARYGPRLEWHICEQCMRERGTIDQIDGVRIQPPFRFLRFLDEAAVCMSVGVK